MTETNSATEQRREQILRLVAKAFYRELTNYGVGQNEILRVANHLLDSLVRKEEAPDDVRGRFDSTLKVERVQDDWDARRVIEMGGVTIRPLHASEIHKVVEWLQEEGIPESFVPALPRTSEAVMAYFAEPERDYFAIVHEGEFVGVIGAENADLDDEKLEMKKMVGVREARGMGIGTKATFAFLYHAFMIRKAHKVFTHTYDTNVRNLNLNSHLGFEVEGILLEEMKQGQRHVDVVRMGLLRPIWLALFSDES